MIRLQPARAHREELIDSFEHSHEAFARSFGDIRRINRYLGGTAVMLRELERLLPAGGEATLLDLGTGSADIPVTLARWARGRRGRLKVVGLDANSKVLQYARAESAGEPDVQLLAGKAEALPFPDGAFDFVASSLTFHHFEDPVAIAALREMGRVARRAVIVNDLRRGYLPAALIWLVTRATGMHPLTRHDAPLSVMRSRTLPEYVALGKSAGLGNVRVAAHPFWRASLVARVEAP
jgi:ubiquinone/menaquinone biosynthesis C-methylase UbiE